MGAFNVTGSFQYALGLCGVFVGVFLFLSAVHHLVIKPMKWKRALDRRLTKKRREQLSQVQILKDADGYQKGLVVAIAKQLAGLGKIENLQRNLLQANIYWSPGTFLSVAAMLACLGFAGGMLYKSNYGLGAALAAVLGYLPLLVVKIKRKRKAGLFEAQMPGCMDLLARSLRAGHALPSSIELASKEIPAPLGLEMKIVYEEQRLGLGLGAALRRLGDRVDCQDVQFFITAVLLQSETGGNLAEIMENIGFLIRERLKLKGKIKALTAEGRFSAIVLGLLPFIVFSLLMVLNRPYIETLIIDPTGQKLVMAGIFSIFLGVLWMKRIVTIKV